MSRPSNINVFQWNKECFFLRNVELNFRFIVMTIDEVTLSRHGLQRHLWILSVETLPIHHELLCWNLRSLRLVPALEWVLGIRSLFLTILLFHLRMGKTNSPSFWLINTSFALILRGYTSDVFNFSLADLLSECLLSQFPPHCLHRNFQPFPCVCNGFLNLSIIRIDEINASQFSIVIELWFFNSPFLLLLFLSCFWHARTVRMRRKARG